MKPKVYLETTIPSLLTARPSRDVVLAGQQLTTREWWNDQRGRYKLYVSVLVLKEVERGDPMIASERVEKLKECHVLPFPKEAEELTRALLSRRLLPAKAETDAAHIATATVHGMDFLLTWNCRHIANAFIADRIRAGLRARRVCRPGIMHTV